MQVISNKEIFTSSIALFFVHQSALLLAIYLQFVQELCGAYCYKFINTKNK